MYLIYIKFG